MERVLAIAVVLLSSVLMADVLVHKVSDGDTVWVTNDDGSKEKVRLNKIDAPEMNQPYGKESADRLAKLILGKKVKLEGQSKDRYSRTLSEIYLCSTNINLQLVKEGLAWHYSYHDKTPSYIAAEKDAREKKIGLWKDANPVNPYQWRKQKHKQASFEDYNSRKVK